MFPLLQWLIACAGIYGAYRLAIWLDDARADRTG